MEIQSTTNSIFSTDATSGDDLREVNSELGKDAFLKILIAQLSNQDPLNPLKDSDFIAQMAQFSTLEQITNMSESIDQMNALSRGTAVSYIGRTVEYENDDGLKEYGQVAYLRFETGGTILVTDDEIDIPLEKVLAVA